MSYASEKRSVDETFVVVHCRRSRYWAVIDLLLARRKRGGHDEIPYVHFAAAYGAGRAGAGLGQGETGKIAAASRMGYGETRRAFGGDVRGVSGVEKQDAGGAGDPRHFWTAQLAPGAA